MGKKLLENIKSRQIAEHMPPSATRKAILFLMGL
jgi:hypothetical protein